MRRRDITLGEMQDECKRADDCVSCAYSDVCAARLEILPCDVFLPDPTERFDDKQIALLKALWDIGVCSVIDSPVTDRIILRSKDRDLGVIRNADGVELPLHSGETLDLAELLGKDGGVE